jgi:hypothetical protein
MSILFEKVRLGSAYDRYELAELWGYAGIQALQRGVVTPRDDNKIILLVTENKKAEATQYRDRLVGDVLEWEGPNDHFAENRMISASSDKDEIHLFHRMDPDEKFTYYGRFTVSGVQRNTDRPSRFTLQKRTS